MTGRRRVPARSAGPSADATTASQRDPTAGAAACSDGYLALGLSPAAARDWEALRIDPADCARWLRLDVTPRDARAWRHYGADPDAAAPWIRRRITPTDGVRWIVLVGDAHAALAWIDGGHTLTETAEILAGPDGNRPMRPALSSELGVARGKAGPSDHD